MSRSRAKLWGSTEGELRHAENHMLLLGRNRAMERVATLLPEMDRRHRRLDGAADVPVAISPIISD